MIQSIRPATSSVTVILPPRRRPPCRPGRSDSQTDALPGTRYRTPPAHRAPASRTASPPGPSLWRARRGARCPDPAPVAIDSHRQVARQVTPDAGSARRQTAADRQRPRSRGRDGERRRRTLTVRHAGRHPGRRLHLECMPVHRAECPPRRVHALDAMRHAPTAPGVRLALERPPGHPHQVHRTRTRGCRRRGDQPATFDPSDAATPGAPRPAGRARMLATPASASSRRPAPTGTLAPPPATVRQRA